MLICFEFFWFYMLTKHTCRSCVRREKEKHYTSFVRESKNYQVSSLTQNEFQGNYTSNQQ